MLSDKEEVELEIILLQEEELDLGLNDNTASIENNENTAVVLSHSCDSVGTN